MAADWPVSAQEAAARMFAQALPVPFAPKHQNNQQNNPHNVNFQNMVVNGQKVNQKTSAKYQNANKNYTNVFKTANPQNDVGNCPNINGKYQDFTGNSQNVPHNFQSIPDSCQKFQNVNVTRPHGKSHYQNINCQNMIDTCQDSTSICQSAIPDSHFTNTNCHSDSSPIINCQNANDKCQGVNSCQNRTSAYENISNCQKVGDNSWNGWLPCFENGRSDNNNDEEILVGANSEVCIVYFRFRVATLTKKHHAKLIVVIYQI